MINQYEIEDLITIEVRDSNKVNRIDPDAEYVEPKPRIRASMNLNDLLDETYMLLKNGGKDVWKIYS